MPPSKLLTFVNKDSCFEGVPSLNTLLYEFKGISLVKGSKHYTQIWAFLTQSASIEFQGMFWKHLKTAYLCFWLVPKVKVPRTLYTKVEASRLTSSSAIATLPKTNNIAPENGWLEDQMAYCGPAYFQEDMWVAGRVTCLSYLSLFSSCRGEFLYHPSRLIDDQLGVPFCRNRNSEHFRKKKTYWQHSPSPNVPTNKPVLYKLTL